MGSNSHYSTHGQMFGFLSVYVFLVGEGGLGMEPLPVREAVPDVYKVHSFRD
jgi:hypothetical protein